MPKYTKTNKEELLYKPFQKIRTKKGKVKFLEELLQERREHPENFRGLNIKIKHIENLIKVWSTRKRKKSDEPTLNDMK
tara:strand:- start:7437 stop:7673 length:237 start_codon:yes stop_codon:yes gene_type:complete